MPKIKILTEAELRSHVGLDARAVKCVEDAFAALGDAEAREIENARLRKLRDAEQGGRDSK